MLFENIKRLSIPFKLIIVSQKLQQLFFIYEFISIFFPRSFCA